MNKRYVVGLGEVLWDVLPEGKKLGGAPANFAYHAGQFLGMDNTIAVSALGEDKLAEETIEALKEHGLNDLLPRVPYPTGTVQVQLDEQGIPTYDIKENVAWDNIPFDDDIAQIARNCRAVCFGSLAQRNVVSRETIQKFLDATPADCLKIFDINLRQQFYTQEILRESFQRCNILKINDEELVLAIPVLTSRTSAGSFWVSTTSTCSFSPVALTAVTYSLLVTYPSRKRLRSKWPTL